MNRFWEVKELAERLGMKDSWVYDRTGNNGPEKIPHVKLGKYVRFNPDSEEFQKWLKDHEVGTDVGLNNQRQVQTVESKGPKNGSG